MDNREDRKGDNSGGDDVLVWLCRDMNQTFEAIHAYLNGEATPFGGSLADWMWAKKATAAQSFSRTNSASRAISTNRASHASW